MAEIHIDRLRLKLSGISASDGQRLAQLIAEGLVYAPLQTENPRHIGALRVNTTASAGSNVDMLSKQIVTEIVQQLEGTL